MSLQAIQKTLNFMSTISNSIVCKIQEIYSSNEKIYLVSDSLKGTHKQISELESVLDESQITRIIEKLLQMCVSLHKDGITIGNLHANNVFIDENYPDDVLVTDVGFAYIPEMGAETDM